MALDLAYLTMSKHVADCLAHSCLLAIESTFQSPIRRLQLQSFREMSHARFRLEAWRWESLFHLSRMVFFSDHSSLKAILHLQEGQLASKDR